MGSGPKTRIEGVSPGREHIKAIVVGAGAARLAATYELRKRGVNVLCLEEKDVAGERARGYRKDAEEAVR